MLVAAVALEAQSIPEQIFPHSPGQDQWEHPVPCKSHHGVVPATHSVHQSDPSSPSASPGTKGSAILDLGSCRPSGMSCGLADELAGKAYLCGTPMWDTCGVHQQVALSLLRGKLTSSASAPAPCTSHHMVLAPFMPTNRFFLSFLLMTATSSPVPVGVISRHHAGNVQCKYGVLIAHFAVLEAATPD